MLLTQLLGAESIDLATRMKQVLGGITAKGSPAGVAVSACAPATQ